jgi:hypothetical protein
MPPSARRCTLLITTLNSLFGAEQGRSAGSNAANNSSKFAIRSARNRTQFVDLNTHFGSKRKPALKYLLHLAMDGGAGIGRTWHHIKHVSVQGLLYDLSFKDTRQLEEDVMHSDDLPTVRCNGDVFHAAYKVPNGGQAVSAARARFRCPSGEVAYPIPDKDLLAVGESGY